MPNQDNQNPDQSQPQGGLGTVPVVPQSDLPPLPTDFSVGSAPPPPAPTTDPFAPVTPVATPADSGSAAPPAPVFSDITAPPKKKFGGGKIIATILGIFVLVGGVAAAVLTINQKQLFQQKASGICTCTGYGAPKAGTCSSNGSCTCPSGYSVATNSCGTNYCNSNNDCATGYVCQIQSGTTGKCTQMTCGNCSTIGSTQSCTTSDGRAGNQTCSYLPGCTIAGRGNWGSCVASSSSGGSSCNNCTLGTTQPCTTSDNKEGTQTCVNSGYCTKIPNTGNWGGCVATGGTSGGTSGGTGDSTTVKTGWGIGKYCSNHPSSTGAGCILITCPNGCNNTDSTGKLTGCSESAPGATVEYADGKLGCEQLSAKVSSVCGQVDLVDSSKVYCQSGGTSGSFTDAQVNCPAASCTPTKTNTPVNPTPTSTSTTVAPYCAAFVAYDADWNLLDNTGLSALTVGSVVNFCVTGGPLPSAFDKAKFIINGVEQAEITDRRSNSTDFCQNYTIPEGTTTFTISAQIHSAAGWF